MMFVRQTSKFISTSIALAVVLTAHAALACPHETQLERRFKTRRDQLEARYDAQRDALKCAHKQVSNEFKYERKLAQNLCGRERKMALRDIDHRRRAADNRHRYELRGLKEEFHAARHALDYEYRLARDSQRCSCHASNHAGVRPGFVSFGPTPARGRQPEAPYPRLRFDTPLLSEFTGRPVVSPRTVAPTRTHDPRELNNHLLHDSLAVLLRMASEFAR